MFFYNERLIFFLLFYYDYFKIFVESNKMGWLIHKKLWTCLGQILIFLSIINFEHKWDKNHLQNCRASKKKNDWEVEEGSASVIKTLFNIFDQNIIYCAS